MGEQVKALSKYVKFSVICPREILLPEKRHLELRKYNLSFPKKEWRDNVLIYYPRYYRYFPKLNKYVAIYLRFLTVFYIILRYRIKFDIIHSHFAHPSGFIGALLSKLFNKPHLITVHGSDVLEDWVPPDIIKNRRWERNFALKKADKIICVSNFLKKRVHNLIEQDDKVVVIPNGVDQLRFSMKTKNVQENDSNKIIMFIGNLIPRKGVHILLPAFKLLSQEFKNAKLAIIGDGFYKPKLLEQIKKLKIEKDVVLYGALPNKDLPNYINMCDILCLPSLEEGFGVVLIEALTCGKPVVASKVGGISDIVQTAKVGYLANTGDIESLYNALKKAITQKWNKKFIQRYARKFYWDSIAPAIKKVYDGLLQT